MCHRRSTVGCSRSFPCRILPPPFSLSGGGRIVRTTNDTLQNQGEPGPKHHPLTQSLQTTHDGNEMNMWNSVHCICHQTSAVSSHLHELPSGCLHHQQQLWTHKHRHQTHPAQHECTLQIEASTAAAVAAAERWISSPRSSCHPHMPSAESPRLRQMLRMQPSHDDPLRRAGTHESRTTTNLLAKAPHLLVWLGASEP